MSVIGCYHPLNAFWTGLYTEKGKKDYVICSGQTNTLSLSSFKLQFRGRKYDNIALTSKYGDSYFKENLKIPCGQCIGCRLDYSRAWAVRCVLESKEYDNNYFITLTYNDENLPKNNSLSVRDLQLFIKRLREYYRRNFNYDNIRFFACGEYGSLGDRPHYHIIFFNLPLSDLKFFKANSLQDKLFISETISKLWPYGFHSVGSVNFETCAYTARYIVKKLKGADSVYYEKNGIIPEFVRMSRRPGIGEAYFNKNKDTIYLTDELMYADKSGQVHKVKPGVYFDKLYDIDNAEHLAKLKEKRQYVAENTLKNKLNKTGKRNEYELLNDEEKLKAKSLKRLYRKGFK